jgi:thiol-disulfide isomerase/thioredoxin
MTEPEPQTAGDHDTDDVTPHETDGSTPSTRTRGQGPSPFDPRLAALYAVGAPVIVLFVALVLATISSSSSTKDNNPTVDAKTMQLGASGGAFTATTLPDAGMVALDGTVTDLPTVAAGKPTVINLFSYSCTACRTEMPALEALHRQGGDRFQMVGVDLGDSAATTRSFVKQTGVTYQIVRDPTSLLVTRLAVTAQPMTLWVDANGTIVGHRYGAMTPSEMRTALREHLRISLPAK